jgi:hypothetical protein
LILRFVLWRIAIKLGYWFRHGLGSRTTLKLNRWRSLNIPIIGVNINLEENKMLNTSSHIDENTCCNNNSEVRELTSDNELNTTQLDSMNCILAFDLEQEKDEDHHGYGVSVQHFIFFNINIYNI